MIKLLQKTFLSEQQTLRDYQQPPEFESTDLYLIKLSWVWDRLIFPSLPKNSLGRKSYSSPRLGSSPVLTGAIPVSLPEAEQDTEDRAAWPGLSSFPVRLLKGGLVKAADSLLCRQPEERNHRRAGVSGFGFHNLRDLPLKFASFSKCWDLIFCLVTPEVELQRGKANRALTKRRQVCSFAPLCAQGVSW